MTSVSIEPRDRVTASRDQEGPVLLATKPFNGLDEPLAVARWLASREERELHVVSVLEPVEGFAAAGVSPVTSRYYEAERTALAAQIRREILDHGSERDSLQVHVLEGPSARTVVDAAREVGARIIVVGTGRHEPIGRYVYGERALEIVGRADRPVLVVPHAAVAAPASVAVVAVDFSPASLRAARAVLPLLAPGGRLLVVHVKPGSTMKDENVGWWNDPYERDCADRFAQFLRRLGSVPGVTFESQFLRGDVVPELVKYAAAQGAGVIACGRLGHSLLARVFVGSVSTALIRQATCPVLIAPELPSDAPAH